MEEKCSTVEGLLSLSDEKVKAMLENYAEGQEESRRLIAALKHLQAYTGNSHICTSTQVVEEMLNFAKFHSRKLKFQFDF